MNSAATLRWLDDAHGNTALSRIVPQNVGRAAELVKMCKSLC